MNLNEQILTLRKQAGMTQEDLASKVGVSRQTISHWELGDTVPDIDQAKKLAEIFCVDLNELVGLDKKEILLENVRETKKTTKSTHTLVKIILIIIIVIISIFVVLSILGFVPKETVAQRLEKKCTLKVENDVYDYDFIYEEGTGKIIEVSSDGDESLENVIDLEDYTDVDEAIDVIDTYAQNNNGTFTCK